MKEYDYEIAKYCVQWDFIGVNYSEKEFDNEEEAIIFAKEEYNKGSKVRVQQVRNIVGWI